MTDWVAMYGAVIGSVAAVGTAWNIYHDRVRLKIEISFGVIGDLPNMLDCIFVEVSHAGRRPITLQACELKAIDRSLLFLMPVVEPRYGYVGKLIDQSHAGSKRLDEGVSHKYLYPLEILREGINANPAFKPAFVEIRDGTGKRWRSTLSDDLKSYIAGNKL